MRATPPFVFTFAFLLLPYLRVGAKFCPKPITESTTCEGVFMESDSGQTTSVWMATGDVEAFEPLSGDATADVCVVGAGIAGLTTAYLLAREGRKVVVLDDGPVAGGETARTTAHLVNALDDRYYELER